jgi:hypothetical protein
VYLPLPLISSALLLSSRSRSARSGPDSPSTSPAESGLMELNAVDKDGPPLAGLEAVDVSTRCRGATSWTIESF